MDMKKVPTALTEVEVGLKKYQSLIGKLQLVDVSKDSEFQKQYNGFYRMRQRPPEFYSAYYRFMEDHKNDDPAKLGFEMILSYFYRELNRIEASFSSKLLSIVNPNMPVWDKFVLANLKLKAPSYYRKDRFEKTVSTYDDICTWYHTFLMSGEAHQMIAMFDEKYPDSGITNIKKIDLILWQMR